MFSEHLFTHKYDIDDIIAALCGTSSLWLNTHTGEVSLTKPEDASHAFLMEPLPTSFLQEILSSSELAHLSDADKTELQTLLASTTLHQLPARFETDRLGGWLRERVKDAALEWLDAHDLIPPSMRHINRKKAIKLYNSRSVTIEDIN